MGEEEDPQKIKRIAAAAYDYENDPRWADYWSNILIPPHMASRSDVLSHFKRKFYHRFIIPGLKVNLSILNISGNNDPRWADYWSNILIPPHMASRSDVISHFRRKFYQRFIDPEFVVEAMSTNSTTQPARSSSTSNDRAQSHNSGSATTGAARASTTTPQNPTSLRWDRQTIQFSVNAWGLVVAVLSMIPLVPRSLSNRAYRLSFLGTACSSLYSLYALYGKPRAWNLQAVQVWFQSVIATKDFIYFIYCLTFVTSNLYLKFALLPILCRVLEHVAKFVRRNFSRSSLYRKYLEESCVWVDSNTTTLSILSSQAEIGIGFLLIISLLSWQRNIIQTFMYWQLLKLMYHAPVTASYHQSAWAKVGRTINPLIHRYAPFLNKPISAAQRWWLR